LKTKQPLFLAKKKLRALSRSGDSEKEKKRTRKTLNRNENGGPTLKEKRGAV